MNRAQGLIGLAAGIILGVALVFGYLQLQGIAQADRPAASAPSTSTLTPVGITGSGNLIAGEEALIRIYDEVAPSVVQITSSREVAPGSPFDTPVQGQGSGFVIDQQGHILTNNHVVEDVEEVDVTLPDGDTVLGTVVGRDPGNDLAVVKVDVGPERARPARLGDSDSLKVGQLAVAIGNPFRFDRSMTSGIVSATGRTFSNAGIRPLRNLVQTDAAINPGNSGGPLINSAGEVIGINTAIENPTGSRVFVGLGFAVPINSAKASLDAMLKGEQIRHPWLGISGRPVTPTFAKEHGLSVEKGIYVVQVVPTSPAAQAGIQGAFRSDADLQGAQELPPGGDVITRVDGNQVTKVEDLSGYLDQQNVGDQVTLTILRDGAEEQVEVTLEAWPESAPEIRPR